MIFNVTTEQTEPRKYADYYYSAPNTPDGNYVGSVSANGLTSSMQSHVLGYGGTPCMHVPVQFNTSGNPVFDKSTFGHFKCTLRKDGTYTVLDKPDGWDDLSVYKLCESWYLAKCEQGRTTGWVKYSGSSVTYKATLYPVPFYTNSELTVEATPVVFAPHYRYIHASVGYYDASSVYHSQSVPKSGGHSADWIGQPQNIMNSSSVVWDSTPQYNETALEAQWTDAVQTQWLNWCKAQSDYARGAVFNEYGDYDWQGMLEVTSSKRPYQVPFFTSVGAIVDFSVTISCANSVPLGFWNEGLGWDTMRDRYNSQKVADYSGDSVRGTHILAMPMRGTIYIPTIKCEYIMDVPLETDNYGTVLEDTTVTYTISAYVGNKRYGLYRSQTIEHKANTYPVNPYNTFPTITDRSYSFPTIKPNTTPTTFTNRGSVKLTANDDFTEVAYVVRMTQGDVPAFSDDWTFTYEFIVTDSAGNVKDSVIMNTPTSTSQIGTVLFDGTFETYGEADTNRYMAMLTVHIWYDGINFKDNTISNTIAASHDIIELVNTIDGIGFFDSPRDGYVATSRLNLRQEYTEPQKFCIRDGYFGTTSGLIGHVVTVYYSTGYLAGELRTAIYVNHDKLDIFNQLPIAQVEDSGWTGQCRLAVINTIPISSSNNYTTQNPFVGYYGEYTSTDLEAEFKIPIYSFATNSVIGYVTDENIVPDVAMLTNDKYNDAPSETVHWVTGADGFLLDF